MSRRLVVSHGRKFHVLLPPEQAEFTGKGFLVKQGGSDRPKMLSFKAAIANGCVEDITPSDQRYAANES